MAGLYIHIPFCTKRCVYCDFFSDTQIHYKERFLSAIIEEMTQRRDYLGGESVETIYLGGGTPSLLSAAEWEPVFEAIYRLFPVCEDAEITMEANPDDLTPGYVASLARLPINRISLGVQSFNDTDLRFLRRRHTGQQAIDALRLCREQGYDNISIDLIYGLPGQTPARWQANLSEALHADVAHISAYHLTYETDTPLYRLKAQGLIQPVDEEVSLSLYNTLIYMLTAAGYQHYEISNFALPGRISRHNSSYWTFRPYLGIGPSAHSYNTLSRQWNISSLPHYIEGLRNASLCPETEILTPHDKYNEYILTGLRTCWGIHLPQIQAKFGETKHSYCKTQAQRYLSSGMLREEGDRLILTQDGWFVSDSIISTLLWMDSYTKEGF
ncbi:MAG: radical SAM family heme chaperone HemW [Tannerellaceae bacterium]|jgi:oxygen-independent coproporphyrinogen-3 oxidase|nr:radical SAM family heme chaperone HemW [Tannerellaceae bacterium]